METNPSILLQGFTADECKGYVKMIAALNGTVTDSNVKEFKDKTSHLICKNLELSPVFLGACVSGGWILTPDFIEDSFLNKTWQKEEEYEHSIMQGHSLSLITVYKKWHWRISMYQDFPFKDWKVSLMLHDEDFYRRLLMFGGARVYPMDDNVCEPEVVYIFMDTTTMDQATEYKDLGFLCVNCNFILDFILKDDTLDIMDYEVTSDSFIYAHSNKTNKNCSLLPAGVFLGPEFQALSPTLSKPLSPSLPRPELQQEGVDKASQVKICDLYPNAPVLPLIGDMQGIPRKKQHISDLRVVVKSVNTDSNVSEVTSDASNSTHSNETNKNSLLPAGVFLEPESLSPSSQPLSPSLPTPELQQESVDKASRVKICDLDPKQSFIGDMQGIPKKEQQISELSVEVKRVNIDSNVSEDQKKQLYIPSDVRQQKTHEKVEVSGDVGQQKAHKVARVHRDVEVSSDVGQQKTYKQAEVSSDVGQQKTHIVAGVSSGVGQQRSHQTDLPRNIAICDQNVSKSCEDGEVDASDPKNVKRESLFTIQEQEPLLSTREQASSLCARSSEAYLNSEESWYSFNMKKNEDFHNDKRESESHSVIGNEIYQSICVSQSLKPSIYLHSIQPTSDFAGDTLKSGEKETQMEKNEQDIVHQRKKRKRLETLNSASLPLNNGSVTDQSECNSLQPLSSPSSSPKCKKQFRSKSSGGEKSQASLEHFGFVSLKAKHGNIQQNSESSDSKERTSVGSSSAQIQEKHDIILQPQFDCLHGAELQNSRVSAGSGECLTPCEWPKTYLMFDQTTGYKNVPPVPVLSTQCVEAAREMDFLDVALQHSWPLRHQSPSPGLLSELLKLAQVDQTAIASRACFFLKTWLEYHPPVTPKIIRVYSEALGLSRNTCISVLHDLLHNSDKIDTIQVTGLLEFIAMLYEANFKHCVSSGISRQIQSSLIVQELWHNAIFISHNSKTEKLVTALVIGFHSGGELCLQGRKALYTLIDLACTCLHLAVSEWKPNASICFKGPLLSIAYDLAQNMLHHCQNELSRAISILQMLRPTWFQLLVVITILSKYNNCLNLNEPVRADKITLNAIVTGYFFLLPPGYGKEERVAQSINTQNDVAKEEKLSKKAKSQHGTADKVHRINGKGENRLHLAAILGKSEQLQELLKIPGVDVNRGDNSGWTPLHEACHRKRYKCVEVLLEYLPVGIGSDKVNIRAVGPEGLTPLHKAVFRESREICKLLLQYGGSELLHIKDVRGQTPLDYARPEMRQFLSHFTEGGIEPSPQTEDAVRGALITQFVPSMIQYQTVLGDDNHTISQSECRLFLSFLCVLLSSYLECSSLLVTASKPAADGGLNRRLCASDQQVWENIKQHLCALREHVRRVTSHEDFQGLQYDLLLVEAVCSSYYPLPLS